MDVPPPALKPPTSTTSPPISTNSDQIWSLHNPPASYSSMVLPNDFSAPIDVYGKNHHIPLPPSPPGGLKQPSSSTNNNSFLFNIDNTATSSILPDTDAQYDFSSRAADLEYSSITNMLGDISSDLTSIFNSHPLTENQPLGRPPTDSVSTNLNTPATTASLNCIETPPNSDYSPTSTYGVNTTLSAKQTDSPRSHYGHPQQIATQTHFPTLNQPAKNTEGASTQPPLQQALNRQNSKTQVTGLFTSSLYGTPEEVYSKVTAPYQYTQGYHALIAYLRGRFAKPQLMVLARSMAEYRPSFIATTKTLQEEDLIFMEKCFQRTLLEFHKFITSSGTPTVVWRRTGQIAAAGREFCILTGWQHTELVRCEEPRFIMEIMDDSSVTKYFDVFTTLAFGDSRGVIMTECTLLKPSGERVRTACTWTVKRDVFDIPMMIIGNFLPILD